jgi:hypothetical protein
MGNQCCAKERGGDMDDVDSQQIKPRTLADSTNSSMYGKDSVLNSRQSGLFGTETDGNSHDSYDSNSILSTGAFTNDPNYSSTEVNIDNFKIQAVIGRGSFGKVYVVIKKDN